MSPLLSQIDNLLALLQLVMGQLRLEQLTAERARRLRCCLRHGFRWRKSAALVSPFLSGLPRLVGLLSSFKKPARGRNVPERGMVADPEEASQFGD